MYGHRLHFKIIPTYDVVVRRFGSLDPTSDVCQLDYFCEAQIDGEVVKGNGAGDAVDVEVEEADDADADADAEAGGGDAAGLLEWHISVR